MREWTETHREGTDCGPIDWNHADFENELLTKFFKISKETLREIERSPEEWVVTDDGGIPRFCWCSVIAMRMYDGWPYWVPKPAVLMNGPLGPNWCFVVSLTEVRKKRT